MKERGIGNKVGVLNSGKIMLYLIGHVKGLDLYLFLFKLKKNLLNLLGWHWFIKLYRFQVHHSVVHHLFIVLCVHHPTSSLLPSPFIPLYPLLPANPLSFW